MIKIYQGTQQQINELLCKIKAQLHQPFYLYNDNEFPEGFYGIRRLVNYLKKYFDKNEIERLLEENKVIASFIFPELEQTFSEQEKKESLFYKARLESRLNVPYGLFEMIARLVATLIDRHIFTIILPDITTIDGESLRVIENYYRHHPESKHALLLGFATDIVDVPDADGITWKRSQGDVQYFVGGFCQYGNSEVIIIENTVSKKKDRVKAGRISPALSLEEELFNRLTNKVVLDDERVTQMITLLTLFYERYSFRAIIAIGAKLLSTQPILNPVLKGHIHGLIGSAATFYQFSHHANPPFDDFLAYHFEEALLHEERPEIRTALLYRITFTYAERKSDLETASKWAEQFVKEASELPLSQKQRDYHLAWAYNVRGHVYAHTNRFENSANDADKAYTLLNNGIKKMEKEEDAAFNFWLNDYKLSIFNLSIHQVYTGDEINQYEYSKHWHKKMSYIMEFMPRIMLFDTFHWIDFYRNKFALHDALRSAEEGIEDAKFYKHGQIYIYTFCAADFNYRIGNASKALALFKKAEEIRPFYNDLFHIYSIPWFTGNCYMKLDLYDEAESAFTSDLSKNNSTEFNISLRCKLALISAKRNNKKEFEDRLNSVIDEAIENGEQNLLIKVASTAAYSLYLLQDKKSATEALNKALEISATAVDGKSLNDAYLFEMHFYQLVIHGYNEPTFLKTIKLIRRALNDIESWWHLPSFKNHVTLFEKSGSSYLNDPEIIQHLGIFSNAFSERRESAILNVTTVY
jgi:tetratricopeptide (TPR) repeat protein